MFKLVTAEERVAIEAKYFGKSVRQAFTHALRVRYANNVIPDVGLCIGVWDVLKVGPQTLQASCGRAVATVVYRLVIFAPFHGEAVWTTIGGASQDVLLLAVPFFGAIQVPPSKLPPNTVWDTKENVWVWKYSEDRNYYYDIANDSVARITHTEFSTGKNRSAPPPPAKDVNDGEERHTQPMLIHAALHDAGGEESQGLGNPEWWYEDEVAEDDDGEEVDADAGEEEEEMDVEEDGD